MKKHIIFLGLFILLFGFAFRSLIFNISTNLIDWRDYAFVTWVINQNITHLRALDLQNLFNLSAFYPYTNTIFLSDTFISQSIISLPFSFFTKNPVLIFNAVFFITFLLNYLSAYLLFNKIFKNRTLSFVGSIAMIFSPFFFTEIGHFQMQSYWPYLLILCKLFDTDKKYIKDGILIGILISIQFLSSVYLAFFGLVSLSIYFLIQIYKVGNYKITVSKFILIVLTFLLFDGVFIKGYLDARKNFAINRNLSEYIVYSAKITDYLFPRQTGIFYQNAIVEKWQSYNHRPFGEPAIFPGLVLSSLAILGLIKIQKSKKDFSLHFSVEKIDLFFLSLIIVGFLFSLGYPYLPFVKYIPLFDTIRGTSRWSFLLYTGIIYFAVSFLSKIRPGKMLLLLSILLILDVFPVTVATYKNTYISEDDNVLKNICAAQKTVVLEIPVTHFDSGTNIVEGLTYITKRLLATTYNHCTLVNGYSGYDLPSIQKIKDNLIASTQSQDPNGFIITVRSTGANYISINPEVIPEKLYPQLDKIITILTKTGKLKYIGAEVYQVTR